MHSRVTKLAAAAVLVLAVLLLARHLTGRERLAATEKTDHAIVQVPQNDAATGRESQRLARELATAQRLLATADVAGLLQLLDTGLDQTKIVVAGYLAQMGEESAIPALQKLADRWQGLAEENPFLQSIVEIRKATSQQDRGRTANPAQEPTPATLPAAVSHDPLITVYVSEKTTGAPIPNILARTFIEGDTETRTHTADDEGVFVLDMTGRTPAYVRIRIRPAGYVGQSVQLWDVHERSLPRTVRFCLEKGTVIGGVVQDESGRPIPGASVETYTSEQEQFEQPCVSVYVEQTTDDKGRWRSAEMPARIGSLWFNVRHRDFADSGFSMPRDVKLEDLRAERAVMVLTEGLTVAGHVTDSTGAPVAGAELLAGERHNARDWGKADEAGFFEVRNVRTLNASFFLTVQAPGFAPQRKELSSEANLAAVHFVLQPAKLLVGRLVDSQGEPVEGVSVSAGDWNGRNTIKWQAKTDPDGRFVWNYPPVDAVGISMYKAGFAQSGREVVADDQEQTFVLTRPMTIRGAVTDNRTGEPIRRFKVVPGSRSTDGGRVSWNPSDTAAKWFTDGHYSFTFLLNAQAHAVRIEADGYLPVDSAFVDANEHTATMDVALTRNAEEPGPSGYVFDANASPVAEAQVVWGRSVQIYNGRADVNGRVHTTSDSEGHFVFQAADRQDLLGTSNAEAPFLAVCDRGIGGASHEEFARNGFIMLKPWARVRGQWRIGNRLAVSQELCLFPFYDQALPQAGMDCMKAVTDEEGRFVFEKVYPGKFILYNETYLAEPGQTLDLLVGGAGRVVKGELVVPTASDVSFRAGLRLVPANVPVPFDKIPKPLGYEQMSLEEVRTWLAQFNESPEGTAYWAWTSENDPQVDKKYLHVTMDDRCRFHVDNVEPGVYVLRGEVNSGGPYNSSMMSVSPGHEHLLSRPVGSVWYEFEVPLPVSDSDLDVPLDLGPVPVRSAIKPQPGDPAPDFDVPTLGPDRIRLTDYRGRTLLLTFLSESCFSRYPEGLEELKAAYRRFHPDARYVQVSLLFSGHPLLNKKAIDEAGLDWPHGLLQGRGCKEAREYGLPSKMLWTVLIGPRGQILDMDLSGEGLTQAVEQALTAYR